METTYQPLLTFALLSYNQEEFIEEAIKGALSQKYSPLEIILSDDCSSDNTFGIMKKIQDVYEGPHSIVLNRNAKNLGLINHVNKIISEIARGEVIIMAAGDDISLPNRVEETWNVFKNNPEVFSVSMNYQNIDIKGNKIKTKKFPKSGFYSLKDFINNKNIPIIGCSRAYSKKLFTRFELLQPTCGVEDSNLVFRSLLVGNIYHISNVGVNYRRHNESLSNKISFKNFEGIINQRKDDLKFVKINNLIDDTEYEKVNKRIESSIRKHIIIDSLNSVNKNDFYIFFNNILFNEDFAFHEKYTYIKFILKKHLYL